MKEKYKKILDKILNEEVLSIEEQQYLDDFYSSFESRPDILDDMSGANQRLIKKRLKENIDRRIDETGKRSSRWSSRRFSYLKIASTILLFILGSFFLYENVFTENLAKSTQFKIGSIYRSESSVTQVQLPDGSLVLLNVNSSLTLDEDFGQQNRRVSLQGEAYFDVAKRDKVPFVVLNNEAEVNVLGTTFWMNDRDIQNYLTLVSGEVRFEDKSQTITMKPNERLSKVTKGSRYKVKLADLSALYSWKDESFLLQNITIEDFVGFLKNRYSVDIRFDDENIKKCSITIAIDGSETLQQLLTMAGMVNNFNYVEENDIIIISGNGCTN